MHSIIPIPALKDNYIWALINSDNKNVIVVDPGDAKPVIQFLQTNHLKLTDILITHHHWDHTDGIKDLLQIQKNLNVYAPADDHVNDCTHPLKDREEISLASISLNLQMLAIPGHTKGHATYLGPGFAFTGDTLFTGGCGRILEGTAEQMFHSLSLLKKLPRETKIYCGHEYTEKNLQFAQLIEPNNPKLKQRIQHTHLLRGENKPTVPSTLQLELDTNPFLRVEQEAVKKSISNYYQQTFDSPIDYFSALRKWKDCWN